MRDLPHTTPDSWADAVFYWLSDHPRATGFILAAALWFIPMVVVGYFEGPVG